MRNFKWDKSKVPNYLKKAKQSPGTSASAELERARKNITRQAMLAGLTVVLTIVILFAMTSAWYTNIVQTSGLMFQAEPWGFDGEIIVDQTPIKAAPGDDGLVNLQVQNSSDSISAISVNVSKNGMAEEMKKRLFFYVDTHMTRSEETMDRVYLNAYEGYTYTVFDQGWLTLTDTVSNAPQIKWEWVYDVLGYYVLGQPIEADVKDEETGEVIDTVIRISIKEYLRPIEYDFDEATTVFGTGEDEELTVALDTVDGTWSPEDYLEIISLHDGYPGQVNTDTSTPVDGFYPVEVDEKTGYGVYAYLCTYPEIQINTQWDTNLGQLAYDYDKNPGAYAEMPAELSHVATLTISAQKNETSVVNVSNLKGLREALVGIDADVIQLSSDITIPADDPLIIPANARVMLDLNEKTITGLNTTASPAIDAKPGSSLTLTNGTVAYGGSTAGKVVGIQSVGAEVVMSNVTVSGYNYGINVADNVGENQLDSRVHMTKCNIEANSYAVFISGNGTDSQQKTQLIIEDSTLRSGAIVLTGSGNAVQSGTDIQIINSRILNNVDGNGMDIVTAGQIQVGAAIYHPQEDGTMTISGSTIVGYTGICQKGGTVTIIDSYIRGNGDYNKPEKQGSGFTDTGDAIYIETTYGNEISLNIRGGETIVSRRHNDARALRVFGDYTDTVRVRIESGRFTDEPDLSWLDPNSSQSREEDMWVVKETTSE